MADGDLPANPRILVCDTDALIQLFIANQGELLKRLKRRYGIQPVITEAAEEELTNPKQPKSKQFLAAAQKAIDNGSLVVLEERAMGAFTSNDPHSTYQSIQLAGQKYNLHIGRGEAFSHAAGMVLRAPVLSNDEKAIRVADRVGLKLAPFTLRAYDLFLLFHQNAELDDGVCENIRKKLASAGEEPPACVRNMSFADGLGRVFPRLVDGGHPCRATGIQTELGDLTQLVIETSAPIASVSGQQQDSSSGSATIAEILLEKRKDLGE